MGKFQNEPVELKSQKNVKKGTLGSDSLRSLACKLLPIFFLIYRIFYLHGSDLIKKNIFKKFLKNIKRI